MKADKYKYKVSFVMPIYNSDTHLDEAIECVINQTIGFEENCQLIFVNDGSTDDSESICLKYSEAYPRNIKYIKQENKGVAGARNSGLGLAEGKYTSFLDSDDLLSSNAAAEVYKFFDNNFNAIDIVSIKIKFFGSKKGDHYRNIIYGQGNRIIDLNSEYMHPLTNGARLFFKSSSIKNKYKFDEKLRYVEDVLFIGRLLSKKMAYGLVSKPTYFYRIDSESTQVTAQQKHNQDWYFPTPKRLYEGLASGYKSKPLPVFIQFTIINDIMWRIRDSNTSILDTKQLTRYKKSLVDGLKLVDDSSIVAFKLNMPLEYRIFALSIKYGYDITKDFTFSDNGQVIWRNLVMHNLKNTFVRINDVYGNAKQIVVRGVHGGYILSSYRFRVRFNNSVYETRYVEGLEDRIHCLGESIYSLRTFEFTIPIGSGLENLQSINFEVNVKNRTFKIRKISINQSWLGSTYIWAYKRLQGYFVVKTETGLSVQNITIKAYLKRVIKYRLHRF